VSNRIAMLRIVLLSVLVLGTYASLGQGLSSLPNPTGPYKIGRTSFLWMDRNRPEAMTTAANDFREVMVYVWYPASGSGSVGAYLPGADRLRSIAGAYTRAFFDRYVRQIPAPLLETSSPLQDVEIRRYGAAAN